MKILCAEVLESHRCRLFYFLKEKRYVSAGGETFMVVKSSFLCCGMAKKERLGSLQSAS